MIKEFLGDDALVPRDVCFYRVGIKFWRRWLLGNFIISFHLVEKQIHILLQGKNIARFTFLDFIVADPPPMIVQLLPPPEPAHVKR